MKKTFTILSAILFLLITISLNAQAQDDRPTAKSYITLFGGVSLPSGDFGKSDYSNNSAGFAKKGVTFGLDGAYYIYRNLGIGLTASFQDQGELNSNDAQALSDGYTASFKTEETTVTTVNRYHNYNFLAGPQYSFLIKRFTIDLRASAGVIKSISTPDIIAVYDGANNNSAVSIEQQSSSGLAFAYGGSAGLRYNFGGNWEIGFKASYVNSNGINISNTGHTDDTGRLVTKQPITELETTLGITVRF